MQRTRPQTCLPVCNYRIPGAAVANTGDAVVANGQTGLRLPHPRCSRRQYRSFPCNRDGGMPGLQAIFVAIVIRSTPERAHIYGAGILGLLHHLLRSAFLFVDVSLDHLRRQPRREPAMLAALEENANHDVGITARRKSDEPPILRQIFGILVLCSSRK